MKDVKQILDNLASPTPDKWREKAEWRRANREWLRKSQDIAVTLLDCMAAKGMTQKELAKQMEVSPQYINRILKGSENLTLETISKFESLLGITLISVKSYEWQQKVEDSWYNPAVSTFDSATKPACLTVYYNNEHLTTYSKIEEKILA